MTTQSASAHERRVRPVYAALLTLIFGWGMGFFYAGRTGLAIGWTIASLVFGVAVATAILVFPNPLYATAATVLQGNNIAGVVINLVIAAPVAALAWFEVARHSHTQKRSPLRLLGYLLLWILPLVGAAGLRFTTIQPFRIPAGSMQPTLHVGDYIFVQKWSYGYSRFSIAPLQNFAPPGRILAHPPERGDIVVFRPEREPDRDFVKRVIGIPGDRVQMRDGAILLNGQPIARQALGDVVLRDDVGQSPIPAFRETLPNGVSYETLDRGDTELDNTSEVVVAPGHYFVMGDDRDNSADSRVASVVGMVPFDHFVGKVSNIIGGPNSR